jgi:uncharacterized protein (TIGR00297 family)
MEISLFIPILIVLTLLAYRLRFLDASGAVSASVVGLLIYYGGGLGWFSTLVFFFVVSSLLTKYRYHEKRSMGIVQEKYGARGWANVFANGGFASFFAISELVYGGNFYTVAYLGTISTAFADTLGTEIGLLSKSEPRSIMPPFRKLVRGQSGAVSGLGLLASFLGSLSCGVLAIFLELVAKDPLSIIVIVFVGGFAGSTFDSILGATVQGSGECVVCGKRTEMLVHHDKPTRHVRGLRFFENNVVNLISTGFGAAVSLALFLIV